MFFYFPLSFRCTLWPLLYATSRLCIVFLFTNFLYEDDVIGKCKLVGPRKLVYNSEWFQSKSYSIQTQWRCIPSISAFPLSFPSISGSLFYSASIGHFSNFCRTITFLGSMNQWTRQSRRTTRSNFWPITVAAIAAPVKIFSCFHPPSSCSSISWPFFYPQECANVGVSQFFSNIAIARKSKTMGST